MTAHDNDDYFRRQQLRLKILNWIKWTTINLVCKVKSKSWYKDKVQDIGGERGDGNQMPYVGHIRDIIKKGHWMQNFLLGVWVVDGDWGLI